MVRFLPAFLTRHRETSSVLPEAAERAHPEPRMARAWRVTTDIALPRADEARQELDLQLGTSLRYEGSRSGNDYWNGEVAWTTRYFLVLDGEHAGARVTHAQWASEDQGRWSSDAFPPAGLEPMAEDAAAST